MPELPEVETIRRSLQPRLLGQVPHRAELFRRDILDGPDAPADLLVGAVITDLQRHGKQLALIAEGARRAVLVHLGMTGRLTWAPTLLPPLAPLTPGDPAAPVEPSQAPPPHLHARWVFPHGHLHFIDPRRFGGLTTLRVEDLPARWAGLGPDALGVTADQLRLRAGRSRRAVKACLLDQRVVAGVGNIYADEALFRARIHPRRPACSLTGPAWRRLAEAIRSVLELAIAEGGSTLRDYADADGRRGRFTQRHHVYGRAGQTCGHCGGTLRSFTLLQRTTTYCPRCQRR
jgi:formamidopyrimidine-DNA glycosylase